MGKWTPQATEEVLLAKIRVAVQDAIQTHRNEKLQDGEARPISFLEFVEELDAKDAFTARLMEILVKEYSERRAKSTPVDRRLHIASRTSKALGAIPIDATVYDNCRPARLPRTRFPSLFRRHVMDEDDGFGRVGQTAADPTPLRAARDQLFQNALNELEDGEFGANWNSNLNEVYAEEGNVGRWQRTEPVRPILHDIDMAGWHVATEHDDLGIGAVRSPSPSSFESELETLAHNQDALSRLRARVGSLTSNPSDSRLGAPRLPLVRRHSLRRSRYGRSPTGLETETSLRQRLARGIGEDDTEDNLERLHEDLLTRISGPGWRPTGRRSGDPLSSNLEALRTETASSGVALRRPWTNYSVGSVASGSNSTTLQGRRSLRRGGLRPPETHPTSARIVPNPYGTLRRSSSLSLHAARVHLRTPDELLPSAEVDMLGHGWSTDMRDQLVVPPWNVAAEDHSGSTVPASHIPTDISNVRVRWTEDLVPFPVTSEAADHQSVSAYPEPPSAAAVDMHNPELSTPPQTDP